MPFPKKLTSCFIFIILIFTLFPFSAIKVSAINSKTEFFYPMFDGYIQYKNGVYDQINENGSRLVTGEKATTPYYWFRTYLRYNLSSIPDDETILSATFRIIQFGEFLYGNAEGRCHLAQVQDIGASLTQDDWNAVTLKSYGSITPEPPPLGGGGWQKDIMDSISSNSTYVSFRLNGTIEDADTNGRKFHFYPVDHQYWSYRPRLIIEYTVSDIPDEEEEAEIEDWYVPAEDETTIEEIQESVKKDIMPLLKKYGFWIIIAIIILISVATVTVNPPQRKSQAKPTGRLHKPRGPKGRFISSKKRR